MRMCFDESNNGRPITLNKYLETEYGGKWTYDLQQRCWFCNDGRMVFKHKKEDRTEYLMKIDGYVKPLPWLSIVMS